MLMLMLIHCESKTLGLIGWLPKYAKPKIWHAIILPFVWFTTKTCQPVTFDMANFGLKPIKPVCSLKSTAKVISSLVHCNSIGSHHTHKGALLPEC